MRETTIHNLAFKHISFEKRVYVLLGFNVLMSFYFCAVYDEGTLALPQALKAMLPKAGQGQLINPGRGKIDA